ncbi:MAG: hypothetical protein M3P51_00595 [Chloroflexota bacterium]|nr:hypothetical protein [Chloroflexota bacterium]
MSDQVVTFPIRYPCLDEYRRYRSFPCARCQAPGCIFGQKPVSRPATRLAPGQKACEVCGSAYHSYGKSKYCSDECRRKAVARQRRKRRSPTSEFI